MENTHKELLFRVDCFTDKMNNLGGKYNEGKSTRVQVGTHRTTIMGDWNGDGFETPKVLILELPLEGRKTVIERSEGMEQ